MNTVIFKAQSSIDSYDFNYLGYAKIYSDAVENPTSATQKIDLKVGGSTLIKAEYGYLTDSTLTDELSEKTLSANGSIYVGGTAGLFLVEKKNFKGFSIPSGSSKHFNINIEQFEDCDITTLESYSEENISGDIQILNKFPHLARFYFSQPNNITGTFEGLSLPSCTTFYLRSSIANSISNLQNALNSEATIIGLPLSAYTGDVNVLSGYLKLTTLTINYSNGIEGEWKDFVRTQSRAGRESGRLTTFGDGNKTKIGGTHYSGTIYIDYTSTGATITVGSTLIATYTKSSDTWS